MTSPSLWDLQGHGKFFLATVLAVRMLSERKVERLILTRPAVEAGERLGFLPGDLQQKVDHLPASALRRTTQPAGPRKDHGVARKRGDRSSTAGLHAGRTLSEAFVILDEAQNTTPAQMRMVLTRLGERSRMVVTGDITQVDLPAGLERIGGGCGCAGWRGRCGGLQAHLGRCGAPPSRATGGGGLCPPCQWRSTIKSPAPPPMSRSRQAQALDGEIRTWRGVAKAARVHLVVWGDMPASSNFQEAIREAQSSALVGPTWSTRRSLCRWRHGAYRRRRARRHGDHGLDGYPPSMPLFWVAIIPWFILFFVAQNAANKANNGTALPLMATFSLLTGFTLTGLVVQAIAVAGAASIGIAALATGLTFAVASVFGRRMSDSVGQALTGVVGLGLIGLILAMVGIFIGRIFAPISTKPPTCHRWFRHRAVCGHGLRRFLHDAPHVSG